MIISSMQKRKWRKWRNTMESKKDLDQHLLRAMFNEIRTREIRNIKTQKLDDKGMIKDIEAYVRETIRREASRDED